MHLAVSTVAMTTMPARRTARHEWLMEIAYSQSLKRERKKKLPGDCSMRAGRSIARLTQHASQALLHLMALQRIASCVAHDLSSILT
jgi:hypothetical protein